MINIRSSRRWHLRLCVLVATCLGLLLFTSGCSRPPKEAKNTVHLRFSVLGCKQESDLAEAFARGFERTHPNIKIDIEPVAGMSYDMKLIMQSAAGTVADVLFLSDSLVPEFSKFHVVRDLSQDIKRDKTFDINSIYPQMMVTGMDDQRHVYMIPRELSVVSLFYNRTLFKRAHVPCPNENWTYEDFTKAAKKLTIKDADGHIKQYGFFGSYAWPQIYVSWIEANGGHAMTNGKSTLSSPESMKALNSLLDMVCKDKCAMSPNTARANPQIDPFVGGQAAMTAQVFSQVPQFRTTMKQFDWDVEMMPIGTVSRVISIGSAGYGIYARTKHPKEAWEFLKYIESKQGQRLLGNAGSGTPAVKSLAYDKCWRKPGLPPKNLDAFIKGVKYGIQWNKISPFSSPEISDSVAEAFEKVFVGMESPEQAFKKADEKINILLAKERAGDD